MEREEGTAKGQDDDPIAAGVSWSQTNISQDK